MVEHTPRRPNPVLRSYPRLLALVGLVLLLGSCAIYLVNPARMLLVQAGVGLGGVLVLAAVLLRPSAVQLILTGRSVRYASNALVMCFTFLSILLLLNFLSFKYNFEFDLTETGQFTLSKQTVEFLENLSEPVQVVGFFRAGDERWARATDYLERYSRYTDLLSYGLHDPIAEPSVAESYKPSNFGLVFINGVHHYEAPGVDEQTITTGLMCVTTHKHNRSNQQLISIESQLPTNRQLFLTPLQTGLTIFLTLILIPVVLLVAGTRAWWLRQQ